MGRGRGWEGEGEGEKLVWERGRRRLGRREEERSVLLLKVT